MSQTNLPVYLDHHATTPVDSVVFATMKDYFCEYYGNPASKSHAYGWNAQEAVDQARVQCAQCIGAQPTEIIFTSGATESTNIALKGLIWPKKNIQGDHIISSHIEHPATLACVKALKNADFNTELIAPDQNGIICPDKIRNIIKSTTSMVSLFWVNNEVGSINNIYEIGKILKEKNIIFHVDAAQALGRVKINLADLDIDMMSISGHKIYGPKGVGVLYIKRDLAGKISPLLHGGGQEWNLRAGTLNVAGIVGMGQAMNIMSKNWQKEDNKIRYLRDILWEKLNILDGVFLNGSFDRRVSGNLSVSFENIDGEELMLGICKHIAVSSGSACSSGGSQASNVLRHMGISLERAQATLRFGIGRHNTQENINLAAQIVVEQVKKLRAGNKKRVLIS